MNTTKIGLLSIVILSASIMPVAFAEKTIAMELFDSEYNTSNNLLVIGTVDTKKTSTPVVLTVYDPNGVTVYKPSVSLDENGKFKWLLKPTLPSFQQGMYTVEASHADVETSTVTTFYIEETGMMESTTTQEVPEFGALTMIVLSVSIIGIIVASNNNRIVSTSKSINHLWLSQKCSKVLSVVVPVF